MKALKVNGNDSNVLSINLKDILNCIKNGDYYEWSIIWLEGIGKLHNQSMLEFEAEIKNSSFGHLIKWYDLLELAGSFSQIINLLLIGDKSSKNLHKYANDMEMYTNCEITLELIDSSYWIICCKNTLIHEGMKKSLEGVEEIDI